MSAEADTVLTDQTFVAANSGRHEQSAGGFVFNQHIRNHLLESGITFCFAPEHGLHVLLHPVPERDHIAIIEQDSVPTAGEVTLLKIGYNRTVNAHDLGVAIFLSILFNRHDFPSFCETLMFRRLVYQRIFDRTAGLYRDYPARQVNQCMAPA